MTDVTRISSGSPVASSVLVTHDESLRGDGSAHRPLGVASIASAQIRLTGTANSDPEPSITYTGSVIELSGGISFGGIDSVTYPGWIKIILTLDAPQPDAKRFPLTGCHFPNPPVVRLDQGIFLPIPPVALQSDLSSTDASMFQPIFGIAIPDLVEVLDITYQLVLIKP